MSLGSVCLGIEDPRMVVRLSIMTDKWPDGFARAGSFESYSLKSRIDLYNNAKH